MLSKLKGIIPPITTPFDANGEIDERAFRAQVKFLLTKGVHGVCVGGSTGEGHTLAIDEFKRPKLTPLISASESIREVLKRATSWSTRMPAARIS